MKVLAGIGDFLEGYPPAIREIVLALRDIILREAPGVAESTVWDALSYHHPEIGGKIKGAVCMIVIRNGKVRLDFVHGIRMHDPKHLLKGDQVSKRYVEIDSVKDALSRNVADLIREADHVIPIEEKT